MPQNTYDELLAQVQTYLARSDLAAQVPDFIRLAEVQIRRRLRVREQQRRATGTVAAEITLPGDFLEPVVFRINSSPPRLPEYRPPDVFMAYDASTSGEAKYFTIIGQILYLWPNPGSTQTYDLWYFQFMEGLSASVQSNALLAGHPDIYLYAALAEAEPYLMNDERVAFWRQRVDRGIAELNGRERRTRSAGGQNRMVLT